MKWLKDIWNNLFGKKTSTPIPAPAPAPPAPAPVPVPTETPATPTFFDDFKSLANWTVSTWAAPGANDTHTGRFAASNIMLVPEGLRLKLTQDKPVAKIESVGAELTSKQKFGYGKYEFVMRASSTAANASDHGNPVSGSITGLFNYGPSSITEIDVEVEGNERHHLTQCTTWKGESAPNQGTQVSPPSSDDLPHGRFFKYAFIWSPGKVEFYRDDVLIATHTKVVPTEACPVMINHWGTNNVNWGGLAMLGVDRFMYVKSFTFYAA